MTSLTLDDCIDFVTTHSRLVLVVLLILTAGMGVGVTELDTESQAGQDDFPETDRSETAAAIEERYGGPANGTETASSAVYVRAADGNALSRAALLDALRYQRSVTTNETLAAALTDADGGDGTGDVGSPNDSVVSVANLVAIRAAEDPDADLEAQIRALESASEGEVASLVERTLAEDPEARRLVADGADSGAATAEGHRMLFRFAAGDDGAPPSDAQRVLYDAAAERDGTVASAGGGNGVALEYFTLGQHAFDESNRQLNENTMELLVPLTLALILGVLAFTYRDPVDVLVGMIGVVTAIVWMFGILGWLGVSAGMTMFIGPILIAGLSIDFGFHVFMRYREQRSAGPDDDRAPAGVRPSMRRAVRSVALALGLVTLTAAIGFLSNVVNPVGLIRDLAVGITLGVVSAFVIFVTLVPALKIGVDGSLERVGIDRHKRPLGDGAYLGGLLRGSVALARRAAPLVLVVALLAGAGGAVAWTGLEEEGVQTQDDPAAEWKQALPGPLAWEVADYDRHQRHVREAYRPRAAGDGDRFQLLIEGDVTADGSLERVRAGLERGEETGAIPEESARTDADVRSPLSVMETAAAENDSFAATLESADTDGDGVPDRDLESVYDALYATAPEAASSVIERTDDGEYRSLRVLGPPERTGFDDGRVDDIEAMAATIESGDGAAGDANDREADLDLTVTAVSETIVTESQLAVITDGILRVLLLALGAVFVTLVATYRRLHGSATLGAVTGLQIALVTALVVGGMFVLDVPLTLLTALLMSLVIGLGIDYSIHVSDRFAQELERGTAPFAALEAAVVGTGGALLGSTLTSAGAFATLLLHPHPQLESFGTLVVLALVTAFAVSVVVLPSALVVWVRYAPSAEPTGRPAGGGPESARE
ncbi:RND family transporter [Natrinema sp. H-ect4]|uniref:efflux RND transporter permease subunit n=1 Tax=Natrinema sp. H-ect4 TaxID=3242699 RepID=UPI0035A9A564